MSLLQMRDICKSFSGVPVLKGVDLTVEQGEIHALLGENGAGKSTLMNILTGVIPYESGTISFDGQELKNITVGKSGKTGIAFVHQELNLFNDLKVYENIYINKEIVGRFGRLDKKEMIRRTGDLFRRLGINIDPMDQVSDLAPGEKQLLEISRALFFDAKLLILDEPTSSLTDTEVINFFNIIRDLRDTGISFIFISHKMPEIFAYADNYTVLRNGEYIGSGKISETDPDKITEMMAGKNLKSGKIYRKRKTGEVLMRVDSLSGRGFRNISFSVRRGEIIGLTGLQGAGSSELLRGIFGVGKTWGGTVELMGKKLNVGSVHRAMKAGIALLPANRKENSVIADMTVTENLYIAEHTLTAMNFHIDRKKENENYLKYKERLNIKSGSGESPVTSLSGGNQQKIFIARWLNTGADILLLDNPTQGIDPGAKKEIYALMLRLAEEGKTILVNTMEVQELKKLADICLVFYNGEIIKRLSHDDIDEHSIMAYSTNSFGAKEGKSDEGNK